jgi:hypothetical protein
MYSEVPIPYVVVVCESLIGSWISPSLLKVNLGRSTMTLFIDKHRSNIHNNRLLLL